MPVSGLAINAGWHFGKVERLTGGFKEGDRIPNLSKGQTFQIPTEKSWRRGFYITVGVEGAAFQRIFLSRLSGAD
ncbi:hypothetical protein IH992_21565 [Candidatus Poribacteria bacterium]|nr:hypothetical protein [Candidatus Poribacteria bacterium]